MSLRLTVIKRGCKIVNSTCQFITETSKDHLKVWNLMSHATPKKNWDHLEHHIYMIFMFDMYAVPVVQIYCLNYLEYV